MGVGASPICPEGASAKSNALKWNTRTDNKVNFTLSCRPTKTYKATTRGADLGTAKW